MMVLSTSFDKQRLFDDAAEERFATQLSIGRNTCKRKTLPAIIGWTFGLKAMAVMLLLTVSLVFLPLVLPPLPPPPPLLLFVPVLIMSVLLFLACAPSKIPPDAVVYSV
ncbi:hypothetical protein L2E82_01109 [Cichorium intybus]|uniref:Uncharacterized protein n=1 Tax=Cichorium intybus TaxID=13427 RepID=A0ACB9GY21_CICIN|nr:hypothetical protein L1887_05116 [Cichorium endivia]KAI3788347.1 hypothetical protein L2E82_01109 [Cichorium intybus]